MLFDNKIAEFVKEIKYFQQKDVTLLTMKVELTRTLRRVVKLKVEAGVLKVTAYAFMSDKRIKQVIADNMGWIKSQKKENPPVLTQNNKPEVNYAQADRYVKPIAEERNLPVRDDKKDIINGYKTVLNGNVVNVRSAIGNKSYLEKDVLFISEKHFSDRDARLKAVKNFLKRVAEERVAEEVAAFGSAVSLCPVKIEFRDNADFWVKCSLAANRSLCFDFRLAQLPPDLRRYVIAHGFAHFEHTLHDEGFWEFVSNTVPDYREYDRLLEKYSILKNL